MGHEFIFEPWTPNEEGEGVQCTLGNLRGTRRKLNLGAKKSTFVAVSGVLTV